MKRGKKTGPKIGVSKGGQKPLAPPKVKRPRKPPPRKAEVKKTRAKPKYVAPVKPVIEVIPPSESLVKAGKARMAAGWSGFTKEQRKFVTELATWGVPQLHICNHIRGETGRTIGVDALRIHFAEELIEGRRIANMNLARCIYQTAIGGDAEYDKAGNLIKPFRYPNSTLLIFLSRVRLRYHWGGGITGDDPLEGDEGGGTGGTGAPAALLPPGLTVPPPMDDAPSEQEIVDALEQMSDDQLRALRSFIQIRAAKRG